MTEKLSTPASLSAHEQEILDTALLESGQLLARSLHDDEARRKRKRLAWLLTLLVGGVAMSAIVIAILFGWLAVGAPGVAEAETPPSARPKSTAQRTAESEKLAAAGWKQWQAGDLAAAEESFTAAVELDPRAANAWNGLGWSRFNSGQSETAAEAFEHCLAIAPKHPAALNGLGQVYLGWKDYERAEKYLLRAAPQATAAHYGLARLYLLQGKFKQARPWAEKVAATSPADASAQKILAAAQAGVLGDDLRKSIEPSGKLPPHAADATKGWQLMQSGRLDEATKVFRAVLDQDQENLSALNGLGFCLLNLGDHTEAKQLFERCLAQEKQAAGPMNGLARCLKAEGKTEEAIKLWNEMAEAHPGPSAATVGLAETHLERGEYALAAKHYRTLVDSAADNEAFRRGLTAANQGLALDNRKKE